MTGGAEAPPFAGKGHEAFESTVLTSESHKSILNDATSQKGFHGDANGVSFLLRFFGFFGPGSQAGVGVHALRKACFRGLRRFRWLRRMGFEKGLHVFLNDGV